MLKMRVKAQDGNGVFQDDNWRQTRGSCCCLVGSDFGSRSPGCAGCSYCCGPWPACWAKKYARNL